MSRDESASPEPASYPEWWVGLERDLDCLQTLLDFAASQLLTSLAVTTRIAEFGPERRGARVCFSDDADRAFNSLELHDLASHMLAELRARAHLMATAARSAAPDAMARAHSRLLAEALSDADASDRGSRSGPA